MIRPVPPEGKKEMIIYVGARKLVLLEGVPNGSGFRMLRCDRLLNPEGFDGGLVTHLDRAAGSLRLLVGQTVSQAVGDVLPAHVVLGNAKLRVFNTACSRYYQGSSRTLTADDVRTVMEQAKSFATLPLSEHILQVIPEFFLVNDMPNVKDPVGLDASRLGVSLKIFSMNYQDYKNLARAFEAADLEVNGYYPKSLTVPEAVLTEREREEGAVIVDIADNAAEVILWKNDALMDARIFNLGARFLTEKIAAAWQIDPADASNVKERYASLVNDPQFGDELVPLVERGGRGLQPIRRQEFHEKFLSYCTQWMEMLLKTTDEFIRERHLSHPHLIFTGGGIRFDGFLEFLQSQFSREARIGLAHGIEADNELMMDPSLTAAIGMFGCLSTYERDKAKWAGSQGFFEKFSSCVTGWFSKYF
jgi:cell division protein FtsA